VSKADQRIDLVFYRGDVRALDAEIVGTHRTPSGLWPSDHFGVMATFNVHPRSEQDHANDQETRIAAVLGKGVSAGVPRGDGQPLTSSPLAPALISTWLDAVAGSQAAQGHVEPGPVRVHLDPALLTELAYELGRLPVGVIC
jgi:hypothetical protein